MNNNFAIGQETKAVEPTTTAITKKKVNIITENGWSNTIESLSEINDCQEHILNIRSSGNTGVDTDYYIQNPQMVAVKSLYDKEVRKMLGTNAQGVIDLTKDYAEPHHCHYNAAIVGTAIEKNTKCRVYFCGGTFGFADQTLSEQFSHSIIYIERKGKGAFVDPTQFIIGRYKTFNLFYITPIEHVINDLFVKHDGAFNPLYGYNELGLRYEYKMCA